MNVKKWTALSVLLFANIFILAHNILPHYHHDDIMCLPSSHAQHCCEGHNEDAQSEHNDMHKHDHGDIEDCLLKNTVVRQVSSDQSQLIPALILLAVHHCCGLSSCHLEEPTLPLFYQQKPYLESYFTTYVSPTLGLRAPPHISFLG